MALISLEEFAGAENPGAGSPPLSRPSPSPSPAIDFETFKSGGFVPSGERPEAGALQAFDKTLSFLKSTMGEGAALADMILSAPGFVMGAGAQLGGTIQAAARGVPLEADPRQLNPVTAYSVGRQAGEEVSAPFMSPLHKVMQLFRSGDAYEQSKTTQGMTKLMEGLEAAGKWVEEATGGRIARDSVPMLADTLIAEAAGLAKGPRPGAVPAHVTKAMREATAKTKKKMEAEVEAEAESAEAPLTPEEFQARAPVQEQINTVLGIKTPAQRAAASKARRKDVAAAFREPAEGSDFGSIEESIFRAEERMSNEAAYRAQQSPARTFIDTGAEARMQADEAAWQSKVEDFNIRQNLKMKPEEAMRILQKSGASRSKAETHALKVAASQEGRATPETMAMLAAAGLGGLVGAEVDEETLRGAALGAASGLSFVLPFVGRGASVPQKFGQSGAVKAPGGMWHPEAVERLAAPLWSRLTEGVERRTPDAASHAAEQKRLEDWSEKKVRDYLNRYAGTERDPLKDVEIPVGDGTQPWGVLTDQIIQDSSKVPELREIRKPLEGVRPGEATWDISDVGRGGPASADYSAVQAQQSVLSYLSHVGDYLRQNVKPEKLKDYDLVRAVRETAENDKRMAKEMEKAQAASTKDLPVHKEYPDGYRWVELKLPEKLTPEQAKTIREATEAEGHWKSGWPRDEEGWNAYVALDASGKPIKNAYTGESAGGATPEEAWLAGRLAEEGNIMGTCVGGYCTPVAAGESRIFSLRDPKGQSHVTVEVAPEGTEAFDRTHPAGDFVGERTAADIVQIKGKQNRAPEAKYIPYVQDFVKEGKWGEVGDLGNTGLVDLENIRRGFADQPRAERQLGARQVEMLNERFGKQRFVPRAELDQVISDFAQEAPRARPGQEGKIDQKLLMGAGALGLGGMVGWALSDDPSGALLGALAGGALMLPGARQRLADVARAADYGIGNISTRIGNISPAFKLRARQYEMRVLSESHRILHQVAPFMAELQKISGEKKSALERAILTNDRQKIADLIKGNQPLVAAWREVRNVLNDLGAQLQDKGRFRSMREEYFPRLVKDVEGLKAALGQQARTRLEKALQDANKASMKSRGTPLTHVEESALINRELQAFQRQAGGRLPGFAKERGVEEVTAALRPFYFSPAESLYAYVRAAVQDIEQAKFFGKDLVQTKVGGHEYVDTTASIGNLVGKELSEGRITPLQAEQLTSLLEARFKVGDRAPHKLIQEVKNLGNIGLLGNIVSAATQMADAAMTAYAQGFRSTIAAIARTMTGQRKITTRDFGLADHIAEEFVSQSRTAEWLNKAFKYTGFTAIDRFGKSTQLNAAHDKFTRWARTPGGTKRMQDKYGRAYGDEFPRLIADLRAGRMSENVRLLLFSELSDMQPISKLELPEGYLRHPNARLVYMLKTFMMKQMDVIRRDALQEIARGNVAKGIGNLMRYAIILGLADTGTGLVKDWLMGRPVDFHASDIGENVLKTFGWSSYVIDKLASGRPAEAVMTVVAPPYQMMDDIVRRDPKAVSYIPVIGKLYYNWELGGREKAEVRAFKERGREMSERAREFQREQRRAKREARE